MIKVSWDFAESAFNDGLLVLYGYGKWGKRCLSYLKKKQIEVDFICDRKFQTGESCFISPEQLEGKRDANVLVAIEKSDEALLWASGFARNVFVFWNDNNMIYKVEPDYEVLGCRTGGELRRRLEETKKIALVGDKKHREDFKCVFDNIKLNAEYEKWSEICDDNDIVIYCGEENKQYEGVSVDAIDLFPMLQRGVI